MTHGVPLVIGGGPAGAAAAIHIARVGAEPLMLERSTADEDHLCGGFLSWRTLERLAALDLDTAMLGGMPIGHVAIFSGRRVARARLPAPGMGLSRRRLDALLRGRASALGAQIRRGVSVAAIEPGGIVRLTGGDRLDPPAILLATGKRDLRGAQRPVARDANPEIGLRLRLPPDAARSALIGDAIELHLFPGGYCGLLVQEDGSANACMAVRKQALADADGDARALLAGLAHRHPHLAARLDGLDIAVCDAIGPVPYGWIAQETRPGLFRLGDQAACIPSLAGEGIGIALASAESAVRHWQMAGASGAPIFQRAQRGAAQRPVRAASLIRDVARNFPTTAPLVASAPGLLGLLARLTRI